MLSSYSLCKGSTFFLHTQKNRLFFRRFAIFLQNSLYKFGAFKIIYYLCSRKNVL